MYVDPLTSRLYLLIPCIKRIFEILRGVLLPTNREGRWKQIKQMNYGVRDCYPVVGTVVFQVLSHEGSMSLRVLGS